MIVRHLSLLEGARQATGTTIIIDVYRAFTTAAVAFNRGAKQIVLVGCPRGARSLRDCGIGELVMGEEGGRKSPGFDFGNSPHELSMADVAGRTLIQSTSAGTKGVVAASGADAIYVASLVNATATAEAILSSAPSTVSIVAMGNEGKTLAEEDEQCAIYIKRRLLGEAVDPDAVREIVLSADTSRRFEDPALPHFRIQDREIALQIDSIPLAMPVRHVDGMLVCDKMTR